MWCHNSCSWTSCFLCAGGTAHRSETFRCFARQWSMISDCISGIDGISSVWSGWISETVENSRTVKDKIDYSVDKWYQDDSWKISWIQTISRMSKRLIVIYSYTTFVIWVEFECNTPLCITLWSWLQKKMWTSLVPQWETKKFILAPPIFIICMHNETSYSRLACLCSNHRSIL